MHPEKGKSDGVERLPGPGASNKGAAASLSGVNSEQLFCRRQGSAVVLNIVVQSGWAAGSEPFVCR